MTRENTTAGVPRKYHLGDIQSKQSKQLSERISPTSLTIQEFTTGLVFGFDLGTASLGFSVRLGSQFLEVGVIVCPEDTNDLAARRQLRRQRRTLRSRKYRRRWLLDQLAALGLLAPEENERDRQPGESDDAFEARTNPVLLRCRALAGERLEAWQLHAAIAHLWKRRGWTRVPWTEAAERKPSKEAEDEAQTTAAKMAGIRSEIAERGCIHPAELLRARLREIHAAPAQSLRMREVIWPRDLLVTEHRAIFAAQAAHCPALAGTLQGQPAAEWLLHGDTCEVKGTHVFFKSTEAANPGVTGLRWPRFDNRGPALDSLQPTDEQGRPLHVVRKDRAAFRSAQWELALMNFRVLDAQTRAKIDPREHCPEFVAALRAEWEKKGKVTEARLGKLAAPHAEKFLLIEDQKPLTPDGGTGRSRYSSQTLDAIRERIAAGERVDPPQPMLQREGEAAKDALNRYLAETKHPLVRHRLTIFRELLAKLVRRHGAPALVVVEAVRSLAMGKKAKQELEKRNRAAAKERENARAELGGAVRVTPRKAIQRWRLAQEVGWRCPYCPATFTKQDLGVSVDIEHLVPKSISPCNEWFNLTVAHIECNRTRKRERTPYAAFANDPSWPALKDYAEKCWKGTKKLEIFLSPKAEELIEQRADLQHTAYIARAVRHVTLLELGWIGDDGRDPIPEPKNAALRFQVTNGALTSRLRGAWGLNHLLHPRPPQAEWNSMSDEAQRQWQEDASRKNRGDLRHHGLDAMVIACTLPWLAHRTHGAKDEKGNHGWWTQDEKMRAHVANPSGLTIAHAREWCEKMEVKPHTSRSPHQKGYFTTLLGKKADDVYAAREKMGDLKPGDFENTWPPELGQWLKLAWSEYSEATPDFSAQMKATQGKLPEPFVARLCFAEFQQWRAGGFPEFRWPAAVKIPIRHLRIVSVKDDTAVMPAAPGTHAFIKRGGFREVRIHVSEDGKALVPVFVPHWRDDKPLASQPWTAGKPLAVIRKGMVVTTVKAFSSGAPPGKYRVLRIGQEQAKVLPPHVANNGDSITAFGLPASGVQPYWPDFLKALGYELPHPASAQPESPGAAEA